MPEDLTPELNLIASSLRTIAATGPSGFEGLVATVLTELAGYPFRLARSGDQGGQDGAALDFGLHVSFEAKLYGSKIKKAVVGNKVAEIVARPVPPDVWVLAATDEVDTQTQIMVRDALAKVGTEALVLDWPSSSVLPPLACLCAMAHFTVVDFLRRHSRKVDLEAFGAALDKVAASPSFAASSNKLQASFADPQVGLAAAASANREWLREAFSNERISRQRFGQAIAASADQGARDRTAEREALAALLRSPPDTDVIVVSGGEGCGKSWIFAQTCFTHEDAPLTLFLPASDIVAGDPQGGSASFLASKIAEQTGGLSTEHSRRLWELRFEKWRKQRVARPNLIVFVDGLNERAQFDWSSWIGRTSRILGEMGAQLAVSTRAQFFRLIKENTPALQRVLELPEWTPAEVDSIVRDHGLVPGELSRRVREGLRNPRVLGIALKLIEGSHINSLGELSIERLLFEHLRSYASADRPKSADVFKRLLAEHAKTILQRASAGLNLDGLIFDGVEGTFSAQFNLTANLLPVVQERFFVAREEDPTLYELSNDGLTFALGIAVIRELQGAERNQRSPSEALATLLEPIAALERTAEIVFAAALLASIDDRCSVSIRQTLMQTYVTLQNIDEGNYPAFAGIVRKAPEAATVALYNLDTTDRHASYKDWLVAGLRSCRDDPRCWEIIRSAAERWLRTYSLRPESNWRAGSQDDPKREANLAAAQERIDSELESLSPNERELLDRMHQDDGFDSSALCIDAFLLLTGMPLAAHAEALVCWAFSQSLNSGYHAPFKEFNFLIRFNNADWEAARLALLVEAARFETEATSPTGKWALVTILRATCTREDAEREAILLEGLVDKDQMGKAWRRVETYCATDPCDPNSERPDNIDATAERCASLDVTSMMKARWMGEQENFLEAALPGLCRFAPDNAIALHRAIAENMMTRTPTEARFVCHWMVSHSVIFEPDCVDRLIKYARDRSRPERPAPNTIERDEWLDSQYSLLAALPHFGGNQQLQTFTELPPHGPFLVQVEDTFDEATPSNLEFALQAAIKTGEPNRIILALSFAIGSGTELTDHALSAIDQLQSSDNAVVRALCWEILSQHPCSERLSKFSTSEWDANTLDRRAAHLERWHGSAMIIEAGVIGLIAPSEVVARIAPERISRAAHRLGSSATGAIAARLQRSFELVRGLTLPNSPPKVEAALRGDENKFARLSLTDDDDSLSLDDHFKRMSETDEEFSARQARQWSSFWSFEKELTGEQAGMIIDNVGNHPLALCVADFPTTVVFWAEAILTAESDELPKFYNFGLRVARALSAHDPQLSMRLFEHLERSEGYVRFSSNLAKIPLATSSVWEAADSEPIKTLRFSRLDQAGTDYALAVEVLAAQFAGKSGLLIEYAHECLESLQPATVARGLMTFGFMDEHPAATEALNRYSNAQGFLGEALKTARYSYDRNRWARHWYQKITTTDSRTDFWRYTNLLSKIADGRVELFSELVAEEGSIADRFGHTLRRPIEDRIGKWEKKRKTKLFGTDVPRGVYLSRSKISDPSALDDTA